MNKLRNVWNQFANFFEHGDLVPFAVLTSVYHFVMALVVYGEAGIVALAQGIFVDMLHFRTVRQAVQTHSKPAAFIAVLTTAMSYAFHLLFYAHNGFEPVALLLAAPLPLGIPVLAWQQEKKREPIIVNLAKQRVKAIARYARRWQRVAKRREADVNQLEGQVKTIESGKKQLETKIERLEKRVAELENAVKLQDKMKASMNPVAWDVAMMLTGRELTGQQIAERHGVSAGYVSGVKSKMNGVV